MQLCFKKYHSKIRRHAGESPVINFLMSRCMFKVFDGDRPFLSFIKFCKNVKDAEQKQRAKN